MQEHARIVHQTDIGPTSLNREYEFFLLVIKSPLYILATPSSHHHVNTDSSFIWDSSMNCCHT